MTQESYPPGLYIGMAGIAWTLLELGETTAALEALALSFDHPRLVDSSDLYNGLAGWGITLLKFFVETQSEEYLQLARRAGDELLQQSQRDDSVRWWLTDGKEYCGLGHGASGIALFLLYLHCATGDSSYLTAGTEAMQYVIRRANYLSDGTQSWRVTEGDTTVTPYWRWGSAGIGMVLLRYNALLRGDRYGAVLSSLAADVARKYSIFPGLHGGLAGMAEFLIDMASGRGVSTDWAKTAVKLPLSGMLQFKIHRETGVAFPGDDRQRITCDFANGNAGIAYVIHRFLKGGPPAFMVDELLSAAMSTRTQGNVTGACDVQVAAV